MKRGFQHLGSLVLILLGLAFAHLATAQATQDDIILEDLSTNQIQFWLLNGTSVTTAVSANANIVSGWQIVGAADFNADGQTDLLFQNASTGQLALWYMNGNNQTGGAYIYPKQNASWHAVGIADFNGDGHPDILFQNVTTAQLAIWYMNNNYILSGAYIYPNQNPAWICVGTGDFNGDGHPDILFQNPTTGQLAIWYMNNNYLAGGAYIYPKQDPVWQAVGSIDLNGDGHPDILFQNKSTGQLAVWYMNNNYILSGAYISSQQDPNWKAVAVSTISNVTLNVYTGPTLSPGFDLGLNTSGGLTNWLTNENGDFKCAYPAYQSWGTVFITVGPVGGQPRKTINVSAYQYLVLDLKGAQGGEHVSIGVKTETDPDNGQEPKYVASNLTTSWQTIKIPLSQLVSDPNYPASRFTHIYIPCELDFDANDPETIYFRNVYFSP